MWYDKIQSVWNTQLIVQINWKLLQLFSILGFSQFSKIVGYDFENILQFAVSERTKMVNVKDQGGAAETRRSRLIWEQHE